MRVICCYNHSSLPDQTVKAWTQAVQQQVSQDFVQLWPGGDAELRFCLHNAAPGVGEWPVYCKNRSDEAGALGYHDVASGIPNGFVFYQDTLDDGEEPSVTFSHEILETLGDPYLNTVVSIGAGTTRRLLAVENCDPVEAYQYQINGVWVSDFISKRWFDPLAPRPVKGYNNTRFDWLKKVVFALEILPGGYQSILPANADAWQDVTVSETSPSAPAHALPVVAAREYRKYSRRDARNQLHQQRVSSLR